MSSRCKFKDCTHINEMGCAILEAIENEDLDIGLYNNYQKMIREKTHFESTIMEKRKKDKDFGKMIKNHKKARKHHKY